MARRRNSGADYRKYQEIQEVKADMTQFGYPDVWHVLPGCLAWWYDKLRNRYTLVRIAQYSSNTVAAAVWCRTGKTVLLPFEELLFSRFPPEMDECVEQTLYRHLIRTKWLNPLPRKPGKPKKP